MKQIFEHLFQPTSFFLNGPIILEVAEVKSLIGTLQTKISKFRNLKRNKLYKTPTGRKKKYMYCFVKSVEKRIKEIPVCIQNVQKVKTVQPSYNHFQRIHLTFLKANQKC